MKVPKEKFPKVEINVEIEYAFMQCSEESNGKNFLQNTEANKNCKINLYAELKELQITL